MNPTPLPVNPHPETITGDEDFGPRRPHKIPENQEQRLQARHTPPTPLSSLPTAPAPRDARPATKPQKCTLQTLKPAFQTLNPEA